MPTPTSKTAPEGPLGAGERQFQVWSRGCKCDLVMMMTYLCQVLWAACWVQDQHCQFLRKHKVQIFNGKIPRNPPGGVGNAPGWGDVSQPECCAGPVSHSPGHWEQPHAQALCCGCWSEGSNTTHLHAASHKLFSQLLVGRMLVQERPWEQDKASAPLTLTFTKPTRRANTSWQPLLSLPKHQLHQLKRSKQTQAASHPLPHLLPLFGGKGAGTPPSSKCHPRWLHQDGDSKSVVSLAEGNRFPLGGSVSSPGEHQQSWS